MTSVPAANPAPPHPGRHRSAACDATIIDATLEVLVEKGYAGLTVAAVIERAGVSSATLYRRWATKQDLVAAAVATLAPEPAAVDTGSLHGDLKAFLANIARSISARREDVADALGTEISANTELAAALREKFTAPRLAELRGILSRAKQRGELDDAPSAEQAYSLVAGGLYHHAFVLHQRITPAYFRNALAFALRGLGAREPSPSAG
jgi:AcrR family transcriptional regulator